MPVSIGESISANLAGDLLKTFLGWQMSVAEALVRDVMGALASATAVSPAEGNDWFSGVAHDMFPVELVVVAPLLFVATISAIFHQDPRRLARAWAVGLPLSLIGGFAAANLGLLGLNVTDSLSSFIQAEVAPSLGTDFVTAVTLGANGGAAGPVGALFSVVVLLGGVAIWLELVLRSAAVELAIFFMPLAFAAVVWPSTAHLAKRLAHLLIALLLAKPVIVAALCLGDNALRSAPAGASSLVTGAAILLLAAFSPMALLKLVPLVEVSAISHLQGLSRQPLYVAGRTAQRAMAYVGAATGGTHLAAPADVDPDTAGQLLGQMGPGVGGGSRQDDDGLGPAGPPS